MDQSISMYLYLHLKLYGTGSTADRISSVAQLLGVSYNTVRQWCSLSDKGAERYIVVWYEIVKNLTWKEVKKNFIRIGYRNLLYPITQLFYYNLYLIKR